MAFENPLALVALISVIPLIILYLLKPKPLEIKIPSVMFLMQSEEDKKRFFTSIRKFIKDPLFLIQLLILILLSIAAAAPYLVTHDSISEEHTVLVIDSSASMQTSGRFEKAINQADTYLSKTNSIVLAHNTPVLLIEKENIQSAKDVLSSLKPKATVADLSNAINTGTRLLATGGGRIIVLSDFSSWNGEDPVLAKNLAQSQGIKVQFINVGNSVDNVGIIQGKLQPIQNGYIYNCVIKNYADNALTIPLVITTNNDSQNVQLSIDGKSTQEFVLNNITRGTTTIKIDRDDNLAADNTAYISIPLIADKNILFVSDQKISPSMTATALIPGIKTNISTSIPADIAKFNAVIIGNVTNYFSVTETNILTDYVNNGGKVVFIASSSLINANTDIKELLPIEYMNDTQKQMGVKLKTNEKNLLTDDINLDEIAIYRYIEAKTKLSATNLIVTEKEVPFLSYQNVKKGTVIYVGFADYVGEKEWNNFHNTPTYPVFWFKLINWLSGSGDTAEYNLKTGVFSTLSTEQQILTPSGYETTNRVFFSDTGMYKVAGRDIAVNLYNDKESDTTENGNSVIQRLGESNNGSIRTNSYESHKNLDIYLIIFALLLIVLEIYIIGKRGELK